MKLLAPITVSLLLSTGAFAQPMQDLSYYLKSREVSADAKEIYNNNFKALDNEETYAVIDSICGRNRNTRPFYLYLACNMAITADDKVRAVLAAECRQFTESHPNEVIEFLTTDRAEVPVGFYKRWAGLLAEAYAHTCHGGAYTDKRVSNGLRTARLNCRSANRSELTTLYNEVYAKVCENEVLDCIQQTPEVVALNSRSKSEGAVTIGVYAGPTKCANYYWVKVWQGDIEGTPVYNFCVDPETFDIYFYDVPGDRLLDITSWRKKLQ